MSKQNGGFVRLLPVTLALALIATGCASVPRSENSQHGLLQTGQGQASSSQSSAAAVNASVQVGTPISIPATVSERSSTGFIWPVKEGKVSSLFGSRRRDYHEGIDIKANRGCPIFASKGGEVIYSSKRIHGYGNMIVIKHDGGMATVYAHCRKSLVKVGARVTQGELVGYVGSTGKATGPHLHFEVRKDELPQDPLQFLPQVRSPAMAGK